MWNKRHLMAVIIALTFAVAAPAAEELSFAQKKLIKDQNDRLQAEIDFADKYCGTKLDAKIAWDTFMNEVEKGLNGTQNWSFYSFCGEALAGMGLLCRDEDGAKEAVVQSVEKYVCRFGGKGKRKMELDNKILTMWVDWEEPNYHEFVRAFLWGAL